MPGIRSVWFCFVRVDGNDDDCFFFCFAHLTQLCGSFRRKNPDVVKVNVYSIAKGCLFSANEFVVCKAQDAQVRSRSFC